MRFGTTSFGSSGVRFTGVLACCSLIFSLQANAAANLAETTGTILVNTGDGFKTGTLSQTLPTGSKVMANQNSEATVSYGDFCVVKVRPGQVYTVATNSPCAVGGQATITAEPLASDYALLGAAGVAGVVGGIILLSKKAASP